MKLLPLILLTLASLASGQSTQPSTRPLVVNVTLPASSQPTTLTFTVTITPGTPVTPLPAPDAGMQMGTNVAANDPWATTAAWCDVTRQFTGFYGANGGSITAWDANGYPATVTGGTARAHCWLYGYPAGKYHLHYKGPKGAVNATGHQMSALVAEADGWGCDVQYNSGEWCVLETTGGISDVHLYAPDAVAGKTFREAYLSILRPYKVIRLMPLARVNGNARQPLGPQKWSDRVTQSAWDQTTRELALEYQVQLCREAGCIPWVNLYYTGAGAGVDDDSVTRTAQLFAGFSVVYVEVNNEFWNTATGYQGNLIRADAVAAGIYGAGDPNQLGARRDAALTARAGQIFRQVLGKDRVKVVLSGQATWNAWANDALVYAKPGDIDVLAVAPYAQLSDPATTVPAVLASMDKWIMNTLTPGVAANNTVAVKYGAAFVAYEGGQHLLPKATNVPSLPQMDANQAAAFKADPMTQAQADPGMGVVYDHLFATCRANGVSLFCHFLAVQAPGGSGYWGASGQTGEADNPKTLAIKRAIEAAK